MTIEFLQYTFPLSGVETSILIPPLVAFGISFFTSMGGISGAFLLLPFQMSVLGFTSPAVTSTNFLFNVIGTPGGVYRYARECRFVWPVAFLIVAGIIPGVLIGYYLRITYLPDPKTFKFFVGCVLLLIAVKLLKEALYGKTTVSQTPESCTLTDKVAEASIEMKTTRFNFKGATYSFATAKLLGLALVVGIIGGVYGIGGRCDYRPVFNHRFQTAGVCHCGRGVTGDLCFIAGRCDLLQPHPDQWGGGNPGLVARYPVRRRGADGDVSGRQGAKIYARKMDKTDAGNSDYYRRIKIYSRFLGYLKIVGFWKKAGRLHGTGFCEPNP